MDSEKGSQSLTVSTLDHYKFTLIFTHIFSNSPLTLLLYPSSATTTHHALIPPQPQTQPSLTNYNLDAPSALHSPPHLRNAQLHFRDPKTHSHSHTEALSSTLYPLPRPRS